MGKRLDAVSSWVKAASNLLELLGKVWPWILAAGGIWGASAWAFVERWGWLPVIAIGIFILSLLCVGTYLFSRRFQRGGEALLASDDKQNAAGNVYVTSHNQAGGITAQNVTINPKAQRVMGDQMKSGLLNAIPRNMRVVVWSSMGSEESHVFASEIFAFLKAHSFDVFGEGPYQQMYTQPLYGVRLYEEGENYNVEVGLIDGKRP